jgi:hypothetical protein
MTSSGPTPLAPTPQSSEGNWYPDNLATITATLQNIAAHKSTPPPVAIFDFDNTCIFRDIGQATFRFQAQHLRYRITPEQLETILPQGDGELAGRPLAVIRSTLVRAYRDLWPMITVGQHAQAKELPSYPLFATLLLWCTDVARKSEQLGPRYVLPFMGRLLAGFTTAELRKLAVEVVAQAGQEPLTEETVTITAPDPIGRIAASSPLGLHPYPEMQQLMTRLETVGIARYVISASSEWLVEGTAARLPH